jgi:two-component system sensor histidine kinase KdpD
LVFTCGLVISWLIVLFASTRLPVDLTVVLLILLTVVVAIALFTVPVLAVLGALVTVVLVNWYLVPPYQTFAIPSTENLVALTVFALVAAVASFLVGASSRARSQAKESESQAGIIRTVVTTEESPSEALERVRTALDLVALELLKSAGKSWTPVATAGNSSASREHRSAITLDVYVQGEYRLVGYGQERFAEDPAFIESLAAAAVRSYESEQMRAEQQRALELESIDRARTALLASVGHDLRTPLSSLRLAVDTLRSTEYQLDETSTSELLETVDESTRRLDELITNMLDLSRLEAGVLLVKMQPVSLDAVVARATLSWPPHVTRVDVAEELPLVSADETLLERVIENVVSNALRHGAAHAANPAEVVARQIGDRIILTISDHGPGLRTRTPSGRAPLTAAGTADSSSGLGLAIVVAFSDAMNVPLGFDTTPGGGLTVRLELRAAST